MSSLSVTAREYASSKRGIDPARDNRFYLAMAIVCALGVFVGFSRTYYLRTYFGSRELSLLLAIHGAVFTVWMIYFIAQTALIADRRISLHRRLGYAGAVLASIMFVLGTTVAYAGSKYGLRRPIAFARNAEGGLFFNLVDIFLFALLVGAGFYFRRNRPVHQRLMLMSNVCALMPSALARLSSVVGNPTLLILSFVLAGPIYDLITRRRIHRAYLWTLLLFVFTVPPIRMLAGNSAGWYRFAHWLLS